MITVDEKYVVLYTLVRGSWQLEVCRLSFVEVVVSESLETSTHMHIRSCTYLTRLFGTGLKSSSWALM